jgi:type IV secretion system protein VirB8
VTTNSDLEDYWREAAAWDFDRVAVLRRSERNAWRVAAASVLCALLSGVALALLVPLKQLVPFLVRVDSTTGIVDVVPTLSRPIDPGQAVTRFLLTHYVTVCERFDFATAESDYRECGAFQSAERNAQWYALWNRTNPASPLNRYKDGTTVQAHVVAVSFLERTSGVSGLAQVRYVKDVHPAGGAQSRLTHWIATIEYAYAKPSLDVRLRSLNPLGFKVLRFTSQPEVVLESAPQPAPR